jgi:hypothetical protein
MGIYSFIKSRIVGAGEGVADLGFVQSQNFTPATLYGPRRNVKRAFQTQAPAFVKIGRDVVPVSILGNTGIAAQGTLELVPLAKEKG